jgi:hypothetical protein
MPAHRRVVVLLRSPLKMDEFYRLLEIDYEHRILICLSCQYAVVPFQIKTHLQAYHKRISLQQRNYVISEVEAATKLARTHAEVVYLAFTYLPIASLPTFFDGLKCQGKEGRSSACSYVCQGSANTALRNTAG